MQSLCSWNLAININEIAPAMAGFKKIGSIWSFQFLKKREILRKKTGVKLRRAMNIIESSLKCWAVYSYFVAKTLQSQLVTLSGQGEEELCLPGVSVFLTPPSDVERRC